MEAFKQFLKKVKHRVTILPSTSTPKKIETSIVTNTCIQMFIVAWSIIIKKYKQFKYLPADEWINKMWDNYTMVYYSVFWTLGRRRGWDVQREQHRNMYIIKGETDHQPRLDPWDKCSGLVHWEDPEGSGGERGGRGDWDGEHM